MMNNLFLFVPSLDISSLRCCCFFNWAPSYLSFALRFFNLFGKTLSHTCFRFESVHTHFSFRRGSLSTHTLGLSGLHSVFFTSFTWCSFVDTSATFVRFPFRRSTWQNESRTLSVAEKLSVMSWTTFNLFIFGYLFIYWLFPTETKSTFHVETFSIISFSIIITQQYYVTCHLSHTFFSCLWKPSVLALGVPDSFLALCEV